MAATVVVAATVLAQVPFALDTAFVTNITSWNVNSAVSLDNGRLLVSGRIKFPGDVSFRGSAALFPDGTRDMSYTGFSGAGRITQWRTDTLYVGVGAVPRRIILPNGDVDHSFRAGWTSVPYFSSLQDADYHVYPDGRVLISGLHQLRDSIRGYVGYYNLIWFSNEGYLDTTAHHRQGNGTIQTIKELPTGQFICNAGTATVYEGQPIDKIFRVEADGVLDTTFHTGVYTGGGVAAFLPVADGRVYAAGRFRTDQLFGDTISLCRFLVDGTLDPTFNIPHFTVETEVSGWFFGGFVSGIYPFTQGRLVIYGTFNTVNGQPRGGICMLDSTGQVLDAFDNCAVGPYTYNTWTYESIDGFTPNADSTAFYINGAYNGYSDGTLNDPQQRFVTRLFAGDLSTIATEPVEQKPQGGLYVYPNPAIDALYVELDPSMDHGTLVLRDALGREVVRRKVNGQRTVLSLAGVSPGIYTVHFIDARTWIAGRQFVVE